MRHVRRVTVAPANLNLQNPPSLNFLIWIASMVFFWKEFK
jgi:hypothetical protein